jgi:hypothetical protein
LITKIIYADSAEKEKDFYKKDLQYNVLHFWHNGWA